MPSDNGPTLLDELVSAGKRAVFKARGLTKVYHMGEVDVHALRGIDLELFEGELAVLLGPSGIGKSSTAFRLIEGARRAGHFATLVSDDQVFLESVNGRIVARAPEAIRGKIELRGSGIGRLDSIGETILRLAVELIQPDASRRYHFWICVCRAGNL